MFLNLFRLKIVSVVLCCNEQQINNKFCWNCLGMCLRNPIYVCMFWYLILKHFYSNSRSFNISSFIALKSSGYLRIYPRKANFSNSSIYKDNYKYYHSPLKIKECYIIEINERLNINYYQLTDNCVVTKYFYYL